MKDALVPDPIADLKGDPEPTEELND